MRGVRGQATIDYLAVVLVVALVAGAMAALLATTDLGERVMAAFARALCVVTGGPCDEIASPCVTSSFEHAHDTHVNALVLRLGHREVELREHRADGSETVTLVGAGQAGLDFGTGVGIQVRWGGVGWAIGSELRAAVLAEHASGRTWTVRDDAAATRLVDQVLLADRSRHPRPGIPGAPGIARCPPRCPSLRRPMPRSASAAHRRASAGRPAPALTARWLRPTASASCATVSGLCTSAPRNRAAVRWYSGGGCRPWARPAPRSATASPSTASAGRSTSRSSRRSTSAPRRARPRSWRAAWAAR